MRNRMKPIQDSDGRELSCSNSKVWPPVQVMVYGDDLESIRASVGESVYHRLKTWERVCGLKSMDLNKCPGCVNLVRDGTKVSKVGTGHRMPPGRPHKGQVVKRWNPAEE